MGGLLVVPVGVITGCLISSEGRSAEQLLAIGLVTLTYMVIGGVDDWSSLTKNTNTGLTPKENCCFRQQRQCCSLVGQHSRDGSRARWTFPTALRSFWLADLATGSFVFLAESNATNLTDGLDGLASGCGALVFTGLGVQLMLRGNQVIPPLPGSAWPWRDAGWAFSSTTATPPGCSWATPALWRWGHRSRR